MRRARSRLGRSHRHPCSWRRDTSRPRGRAVVDDLVPRSIEGRVLTALLTSERPSPNAPPVMLSRVLLPVPTPDSYEMIWSFPSEHRRLKHREMRVTLDGTWRVPLVKRLFFSYPLSLFIQVPSRQRISLLEVVLLLAMMLRWSPNARWLIGNIGGIRHHDTRKSGERTGRARSFPTGSRQQDII